jgi:hypothetical protein
MSQRQRARPIAASSTNDTEIVVKNTADTSQLIKSDDDPILTVSSEPDQPTHNLQALTSIHEHIMNGASVETDFNRWIQRVANQIPATDIPTIQSCRESVKELSEEIFASWSAIHTVLVYHEQLIRKRWTKMNMKQKEELLLTAWPNMNLRHRPDLERMLSCRDWEQTRPVMPADLQESAWPYINLEDLLRPKSFLLLLNSRGRHRPDSFAYSDLELAPLFKVRKEFLALRQDNFTMKFIGRHRAESYGELIEWKDKLAAAKSIKEGRSR